MISNLNLFHVLCCESFRKCSCYFIMDPQFKCSIRSKYYIKNIGIVTLSTNCQLLEF